MIAAARRQIPQNWSIYKPVKDTVILTIDGLEVYQNDIDILCDDYISTLPDSVSITKPSVFSGLLKYIYKHKVKQIIDTDKQNRNNSYNNNHDLLDMIFENIYTVLCSRYSITPTIQQFCVFVGIDKGIISDINKGFYRQGNYKVNPKTRHTVKKWYDYCESVSLGEATRGSIGDIFNLKANYQYRDNVQQVEVITSQDQTATPEQIAERYKDTVKPSLPDLES